MEQSTDTDAKLRRRITEAIEAAWAPEDDKAIENAANAAMNVVSPELERLNARAERARDLAQRWLNDLRHEDQNNVGIKTAVTVCQQVIADLEGAW